MMGETGSGEVPRYGEGEGEASSMDKAAERAKDRGPGTAEAPGRTVAGKTSTGEPTQEQAPRQEHGVADHRPSQA